MAISDRQETLPAAYISVDEATKRKQMEALVLKELEERNGGGGMDSRPGTGKF